MNLSALDWAVLSVGILAIVYAVYRAIQERQGKDERCRQSTTSSAKANLVYHRCSHLCCQHRFRTPCGSCRNRRKGRRGMAHWEMQGWMILILGWLFVPFYQLLIQQDGQDHHHARLPQVPLHRRTGSWLSIITSLPTCSPVSVTAFTGGIFFEYLLAPLFWYGAIGLIAITAASLSSAE